MTGKKHFNAKEAKEIDKKLGIDWSKFNVEQYTMELDIELKKG